jgi:hypothetical protein
MCLQWDIKYHLTKGNIYKVVSKSFKTGRLEREMQMVQLSATRYSCIAILWISLLEFCRHDTLRCFSISVCCCRRLFRYRRSPETLDTPSYFPPSFPETLFAAKWSSVDCFMALSPSLYSPLLKVISETRNANSTLYRFHIPNSVPSFWNRLPAENLDLQVMLDNERGT